MLEMTFLQTAAENATEAAGSSLARSLHRLPVTIGLSGALGTGKTTFMRGFLRGLGVDAPVTSPTHALEHRYDTPLGETLHVDLYRLSPAEAIEALRSSDDHPGIRCVEWPERTAGSLHPEISIEMRETERGHRSIAIDCSDVDWPTDATIDAWRQELRLPPNVAAHCDAVADVCARLADALIERGTFVRKGLVRAAGKTHDLLRFIDFRETAAPKGYTEPAEDRAFWNEWKSTHDAKTHEEAVHLFLTERGFPALARVALEHSVHFPLEKRTSTESHILYYADKRLVGDKPVTVAERYADFAERYRKGTQSPDGLRWERETLDTEKRLFPDGVPF